MKLFVLYATLIQGYQRTTSDLELCHVTETMIPSPSMKMKPGLECTRLNNIKENLNTTDGDSSTAHISYPWQVRLTWLFEDNMICAGSIISDEWVLTAASCCDGKNNEEMNIHVGDWRKGEQMPEKFVVQSKEVIIHPGRY